MEILAKRDVLDRAPERKQPFLFFLSELGLIGLSSLLFALSFPSFLSDWGWFPLAYVSIAPVFILVHRCSFKGSFFYGALYGFVAYSIFNYWASTFHPFAIVIISSIYAFYFFLLFPILKLTDSMFPRYGYIVQSLIWIAYEYLRTLGFVGYPYGNIGYTQYLFIPLIQISSITGMWGVSLLVLFPSAFIGNVLSDGFSHAKEFFREQKKIALVYVVVLVAVLLFGVLVPRDYSDARRWKVAMIQHNADTWKGGVIQFKKNLESLIRLSNEAMKEKPDIVIWSETAFVPGVDWHSRYRTDDARYDLVRQFKEFMATQTVPYVTGNDDGQIKVPGAPLVNPDGTPNRVDYNAVLLYADGELKQTYRKTHLVPFTENFPYKETFPRFYQLLVNNDYHFWEKGTEYTVFDANGVKFSTPICFEDVFGDISRRFVNEGAQVIVNLTNDSWSGSVAAEMQHMAMAVFRAVENRRSVVRSTNSGITCTIEPDGRITSMLEPFTEGYLVHDVPVYDAETTLYTRWGDYFAIACLVISACLFVYGAVRMIIEARGKRMVDKKK